MPQIKENKAVENKVSQIAVEIASEDASDHNAMKGQNPEMTFPKF